MIYAILRAQWLSMRGFGLGRKRRSFGLGLLGDVLYYGFWCFAAFGIQSLIAANRDSQFILLNLILFGVFLYWQIAPVITATMGAALDLKKLLIYPVPHGKLFLIDVVLRVTAAIEMPLMLAGVFVGLLRNPDYGGARAIPRLLIPLLAFAVFNLLAASGVKSSLERLMRRRRMREILILLFAFAVAIPQVLMAARIPRASFERFLPSAALWPWGAVANLLLRQHYLVGSLALTGFILVAFSFGRAQFEKTLRSDGSAPGRALVASEKQQRPWGDGLFRLPGLFLRDPVAAVTEKELRALTRSPAFRTVFIMGFSFGLLVFLPTVLRGGGGSSVTRQHFLTFASVYALVLLGQTSYWNAFGFERSSVQFYFCAPVPFSAVLRGKNIAIALLLVVEMLLVALMTSLFRLTSSVFSIAEAFSVALVAALYFLAFGNLSSVYLPRPMDPDKSGQQASKRSFNALLFMGFPILLLPVALAYWADYVFQSHTIFFALLGFAGLVGAILYWVALDSATKAAQVRRERILTELSRGEGPLSAN